ncbi:hypothetical protein [Altericista sp. CCNU0014]|uniref:hypothetical protein n=1 Tax=Altericista sp. CCNU0014 TaxID=3082949 RepID=UPI00384C7B5B
MIKAAIAVEFHCHQLSSQQIACQSGSVGKIEPPVGKDRVAEKLPLTESNASPQSLRAHQNVTPKNQSLTEV